MGAGYNATCLLCNHQFHFLKGRGTLSFNYFCDQCGESKVFSYTRDADVDFAYSNAMELSYEEKLARVISAFDSKRKEYEQFDFQCNCGGTYTSEAPPRCPICRNDQLATSVTISWD